MRSAGAAFRNHLAECMKTLGYKECLADPDVWMRPATHSDGFEYYEYILIYSDDLLAIGENPKAQLTAVDRCFPLKPGSLVTPDLYLGAKVTKVTLPNGVSAWGLSPSQ